jgi:hypothetical protein
MKNPRGPLVPEGRLAQYEEGCELARSDVPLPSDYDQVGGYAIRSANSDGPFVVSGIEDDGMPDITMEDIIAFKPAYSIRYQSARRTSCGKSSLEARIATSEQVISATSEPPTGERFIDWDARSALSDVEYLVVDFMDQETVEEFIGVMGDSNGWVMLADDG